MYIHMLDPGLASPHTKRSGQEREGHRDQAGSDALRRAGHLAMHGSVDKHVHLGFTCFIENSRLAKSAVQVWAAKLTAERQ